tara:strand:+ start:11633 stop:12034 length:402 start_codon:yes stop_codon:yes gene_type:complete
MKKIIFCASLLFSFNTFAADSSSGCGVGWQVTQRTSLSASSTRSTTNAILPNTISMTSGISGCAHHSIVKVDSEVQYFAEANLENLQLEIAQGNGEYLVTLSNLMGCDAGYTSRSQAMPIPMNAQDLLSRGCL